MVTVKRWFRTLLYDPYSPTVRAVMAIGLCLGIAILIVCLAWLVATATTPPPVPAIYRPVPTITAKPGGCIGYDAAPEYFDSHPQVTPCVAK